MIASFLLPSRWSLPRLALFVSTLLGLALAGCSSTPDCGDRDHPYLTAQQGQTLRAPAGAEVPNEDFSTMIPDVPVEAVASADQQRAMRGCLTTPPKFALVSSEDDQPVAVEPRERTQVPRNDLPKVPVY